MTFTLRPTFLYNDTYIICTFDFLGITVDAGRSKSSELVEKLLSDYGPRTVRPVKNESTITTVVVQLLVTQIIALVRHIKISGHHRVALSSAALSDTHRYMDQNYRSIRSGVNLRLVSCNLTQMLRSSLYFLF